MIAKAFSMRYTIESAQPLTFSADYSFDGAKAHLRYATTKGIFDVSSIENGGSARIAYSYEGRYSSNEAALEVKERLGLSHDINTIYGAIDNDPFIHEAIMKYNGMRVTKNPPWETALSFVVSQFNNVKRIRRIMRALIGKFGEELDSSNGRKMLFPEPDAIASASIGDLNRCGTGFRSKYIKGLAESWHEVEKKNVGRMGYEDAKGFLMQFDGIGDKVADCILLMGYGMLEAFPIDTWIKRVMERQYMHRRASIKAIHQFADAKWGAYAGYAQQYIYWHGRSMGRLHDTKNGKDNR